MEIVINRHQGFRVFVTLLCAMTLALSGCTSVYTVTPEKATDDKRVLRVGKPVTVVFNDGRSMSGTIASFDKGHITVIDESNGARQKIAFSTISEISGRRVSVAKTTGLVIAGLFAAMVAALASIDCFIFCFSDT
ncbi:MAG: hypothetical protein AAF438_08750 [Pseudomonadota bacterium]